MKTYFVLIFVLSLLKYNACSAQVYIFAREDKPDIIQSFNADDGNSKIQKQIAEHEGKWFSLLESDVPGYGAVFCVADPNGSNPKYFISLGKRNPAEAIVEARSKAQDYSKGKINLEVFVMRTFNNQNKFPLKRN